MNAATLAGENETLRGLVVSLQEQLTQVQRENQLLRQKLEAFIRRYFGGGKSEAIDPKQLELLLAGLGAPMTPATEAQKTAAQPSREASSRRTPSGRQPLPEHLPVERVVLDPEPVRVMDPEVPNRCATGWLWVLGAPGGDVMFEFHPGRGKEFATELLGSFRGQLQRDGYGVYGALARANPGLIPVGCWAHARRKFVEALDEQTPAAIELVGEIRKLYLLEQRAREECLPPQARCALRAAQAAPILNALKPRLEQLAAECLPQSPLGKAVRYTLAEWEPLTRYLQDGRLEIDNNLTENAIRPSAVGKKNWLFIGHPDAGWRSAVVYSVIVSCRRRGIDPWEYVRDVLERIPGIKTSELPSLLPKHWKPAV